MGVYFTTNRLKLLTFGFIVSIAFLAGMAVPRFNFNSSQKVLGVEQAQEKYWFLLHRKSNVELLYRGIPGSASESALIKTFQVKTGEPGKKPTPLPQLVGKEYWVITKKYETFENLETAPYFLELNVPQSEVAPYGPEPYLECDGQCNWEIPGPFGLHGVNNDNSRLTYDNLGSSGCIRHTNEDITYLFNTINTEDEVRYYIEDR